MAQQHAEQLEPLLASTDSTDEREEATQPQAQPQAQPHQHARSTFTTAATTAATHVQQFIQDAVASARSALPHNTAATPQFHPPLANMPDIPDLFATWHAHRNIVCALGVVGFLTILVRFFWLGLVPGALGLAAAGVYYADAWTPSICHRAKVTRSLSLACAIVSGLLAALYTALLLLLAVSPSWDESIETRELMPSLVTIYIIVLCQITWYGVLSWLAVMVTRGMRDVLAAGNPVSAGIL